MIRLRLTSILCCVWLSIGAAHAHAVIVGAKPAANAKVSGEAVAIELRFNSRIDAARSTLKLFDQAGAVVSLDSVEADEDALKSGARKLAPGPYRLHWQTLSPDGHISQGDIPFEVER